MRDTKANKDQNENEAMAVQARCVDLPNDAEEGHYWSWVNAPQSIPSQYRHCMLCDRIDASEWLASDAPKSAHPQAPQGDTNELTLDELVVGLIADGTKTWMPPSYEELEQRISRYVEQERQLAREETLTETWNFLVDNGYDPAIGNGYFKGAIKTAAQLRAHPKGENNG